MGDTIASVIVTYNRKALLAEAVSSLLSQTYPISRIIIIDNASTDGSKEYLEDHHLLNENVDYVVLPENLGGAGGFYHGIERAIAGNFDWISLSDDDAIFDNRYFEEIIKSSKENPQVKAFAGAVMEQGELCPFHRARVSDRTSFEFSFCGEEFYRGQPFPIDIFSFVGSVIHTSIIRQIGLPDKDYFIRGDDSEYALRVGEKTEILCVPQAVVNHKIKPKKESGLSFVPDWKDFYELRNHYFYAVKHSSNRKSTYRYIYTGLIKRALATLVKGKYAGHKRYRLRMLNDIFWAVMRNKKGKNERYLPGK